MPDTWTEFDSDTLTAVQQKALFMLTAAGMVDRKFTLRMTMHSSPTAVEAVITATGECGFAEAMEPVLAAMWEDWKEPYHRWKSSEMASSPSGTCERVKPELWRLNDQGLVAKADITSGESQRVIDFVLWQGFFDGKPRLVDGRIKGRQPVRGEGQLVSMRKYSVGQPPSGQVIIGNWEEGARAFAEAIKNITANENREQVPNNRRSKSKTMKNQVVQSSTTEAKTVSPTEEWSAPMSKSEMARRITREHNARPRKVEVLLNRWGLQRVKGNLWQVRLDLMDADSRKRIEKQS